jgi:proteasome accessory factor A
MRWDYGSEDPHADMRGFHVDELRQDFDEAQYFAQDIQRELTFAEIKSDFVIGNGARFYNDHAHPEYCTPECSALDELVAHDRAGERILMACAHRLSEQRGSKVRLYKNNTDFRGHSYGCHENYLLPRSLPWETLVEGIQAFLVTRKSWPAPANCRGDEDRFVEPAISQRSDFISELQSVDTMQRRPIINTRDEPHADPRVFRRFHVIIGDANMSPFATRLKVGTTALVLEALVRDPRRSLPQLADPLEALQSISRDPRLRWEVGLEGESRSTALAIQRTYLNVARQVCDLSSPSKAALVADWESVLNDLESDIMACRNRLDWVAKLGLVRDFQAGQNLADDDPWLQSLDLEYHRMDLTEGLYYGLEQTGAMLGVPDAASCGDGFRNLRGQLAPTFMDDAFGLRPLCLTYPWDHITLQGGTPIKISLLDLFAREASRYGIAVDAASTPDDLRKLTIT